MRLLKRLFGMSSEPESILDSRRRAMHEDRISKNSITSTPPSAVPESSSLKQPTSVLDDPRTTALEAAQLAYMQTRTRLKTARDQDKRAKEIWQEAQQIAKRFENEISREIDDLEPQMSNLAMRDNLFSMLSRVQVTAIGPQSETVLAVDLEERFDHPILREQDMVRLRQAIIDYVRTRRVLKEVRADDRRAKECWQTAQANAPDVSAEIQQAAVSLDNAVAAIDALSTFPLSNPENANLGRQVDHLYQSGHLQRTANAERVVSELMSARKRLDLYKAADLRKTRKSLPSVGSSRAQDILNGIM